jgi:hypothetical protein
MAFRSGWNMPPGCFRVPDDELDPPNWYQYSEGTVKRGRKCTSPNCQMGGRIPPGFRFQQWVTRDGDEVIFTQTCAGDDSPCSVKYKPCPDGKYDYYWSYLSGPKR